MKEIKRDNIKSKSFLGVLVVLCMIIPFWMLKQGIDLKDTGYQINMGKFLVCNPETTNYPMFLCALFSHIFLRFFEICRIPVILGFKIAKIMLVLCSDILIYNIYRKYINQYLLLLMLAGCNLILLASPPMMTYNTIGELFSVLLLFFLYKGEIEKKNWAYMAAGGVYAINIFVRFPNIVQGIVIVAIVLTICWEKEKDKLIRKIGCFLGGGLIGLLLMFGLVQIYIGVPSYLQAIKGLFNYAGSEDTIYNLPIMLRSLLSEGIHGVIKFIKLLFPVIIGSVILQYAKLNNWGGVLLCY